MATKKTLAVFGATGYQGGAVARHFLAIPDSPYRVLALTRNPMSSTATALSALGAQILQADLDDPVSLTHSLASAHAVFLVTDFWSCPDPAGSREKQQAMRALGILAQSPVLEHLILSSLPSIRDISGGKYTNVVHFDGKAEVVRWLEETYEGLWKKTTVLWVGSYMQLWKQFPVAFGPEKTEEGVWRLRSTFNEDTKLPLVDVSDTGKAVRGILEKSIKVMKKTVGLVGEDNISVTEQLILWGKSVGAEVDYIQISEQEDMERAKQTTGFDEYLLRDLVEVKLAFRNYEGKLVHGEGIVQAKDILPEGENLTSWEQYVKNEEWKDLLGA